MAIKFLNTVQVDTDVLYVNAANDRVGIGTTGPSSKLQVQGSTVGYTGSTAESLFRLSRAGTGQVKDSIVEFSLNRQDHNDNHPTTQLDFNLSGGGVDSSSASQNVMTLLSNDNGNFVGIGTTSPDEKLDVAGNIMLSVASSFIKTYDGDLYLSPASNNVTLYPSTGTAAQILNIYNGTSDHAIKLNSSGNSWFNGGNVGIKTTSPVNPLGINFAPNGIGSITTSNNSTAWNTSSAIMLQGASGSNGLGFGISGTANDRKSWIQSGHPGQQYANYLGTLAINPLGGNVGIGTTSPGFKLDVAGTGNFTGLVSGITPVAAANFVTKAYADGLTPGAGVFLPLAGGTMTGNLDISDNTLMRFGAGNDLIISHQAGPITYGNFINSSDTVRDLIFRSSVGFQFKNTLLVGSETLADFNTNGSVDLYYDNSKKFETTPAGATVTGSLGVGTTTPSYKLHVKGGNDAGIIAERDTSGTEGQIFMLAGDTTNLIASKGSGNNAKQLNFNIGIAPKVSIDTGGNVGIGTTSPQEKVHVSGSSNIRLEVEATDSTVAALKLTNTAGSYASFVDASGSLSTYDYNAASTRTTLLANGNLGIGTTTPGAKLDVNGSLRAASVQLFSGSTQYLNVSSYGGNPWINTASSGGVINFGAPSSNTTNVYVQGTVEARDGLLGFVPTFVHGGFYHSSSSSSSAIYWIPSNYISETTSTQYYNRFVAPYPGRVKKVIMRWTNGSTPTATSVTFRKTQNGGVSSTQYAATVTGGATTSMVATKEFSNTDFTFNAGDKYGIGFMTNGGTRLLYGMTYTLVIEYDI